LKKLNEDVSAKNYQRIQDATKYAKEVAALKATYNKKAQKLAAVAATNNTLSAEFQAQVDKENNLVKTKTAKIDELKNTIDTLRTNIDASEAEIIRRGEQNAHLIQGKKEIHEEIESITRGFNKQKTAAINKYTGTRAKEIEAHKEEMVKITAEHKELKEQRNVALKAQREARKTKEDQDQQYQEDIEKMEEQVAQLEKKIQLNEQRQKRIEHLMEDSGDLKQA